MCEINIQLSAQYLCLIESSVLTHFFKKQLVHTSWFLDIEIFNYNLSMAANNYCTYFILPLTLIVNRDHITFTSKLSSSSSQGLRKHETSCEVPRGPTITPHSIRHIASEFEESFKSSFQYSVVVSRSKKSIRFKSKSIELVLEFWTSQQV